MKEKKKSGRRWLIVLSVFFGLILVVIGGLWLYFLKLRADLTDDAPVIMPTVTVTNAEKKQLVKEYETIRKGVKQGKKAEINLPSDKIDKMIALVDDLSFLRGKVSVALQDDVIRAHISVPLEKIPLFDGRYLNGEFKVKAKVINGKTVIRILEGKTERGMPYPQWMLDKINDFVASPKVMEHPKAKWLEKVELMEVKEGNVTLKTK